MSYDDESFLCTKLIYDHKYCLKANLSITLTRDVKQKAIDVGFVSVGVSNPNKLHDLPYGWVGKIEKLYSSEEILPNVKSVILMAFNAWDKSFNLSVTSPSWKAMECARQTSKLNITNFITSNGKQSMESR